MKCKACGARWYGIGSYQCMDCGSDKIDVDVPMPRKPRKAKKA